MTTSCGNAKNGLQSRVTRYEERIAKQNDAVEARGKKIEAKIDRINAQLDSASGDFDKAQESALTEAKNREQVAKRSGNFQRPASEKVTPSSGILTVYFKEFESAQINDRDAALPQNESVRDPDISSTDKAQPKIISRRGITPITDEHRKFCGQAFPSEKAPNNLVEVLGKTTEITAESVVILPVTSENYLRVSAPISIMGLILHNGSEIHVDIPLQLSEFAILTQATTKLP